MSLQLTHPELPFRGFGRVAAGNSDLYKPTSASEVQEVFDIARRSGRRVVIRGGGHSFDDQALHNADNFNQIILSTDNYEADKIKFDDPANKVTLGCGVRWGTFFDEAVQHSINTGGPIRIPGSMQTGRGSTAGGTLAGDCLSRFSGTAGKESHWIDSFRIVTPNNGLLHVDEASNPDLFHAVIGGHGFIGFVTDITYKLIQLPRPSRARSKISPYYSLRKLVDVQNALLQKARKDNVQQAISAVWFTDVPPIPLLGLLLPARVKGAVFQSWFENPSKTGLSGFSLYEKIHSCKRYYIEILARHAVFNWLIHEVLYELVARFKRNYENDLGDFIFFMDGDAMARKRFERLHPGQLFPILQQTYVVPLDRAVEFARYAMSKMGRFRSRIYPAECDMLFVAKDKSLMSANYNLDGFAISFGFEPDTPHGPMADRIITLLKNLSEHCQRLGGRIHLVKSVYAEKKILRSMFSPQILEFEKIKRQYDPELLLQNSFSDRLFDF